MNPGVARPCAAVSLQPVVRLIDSAVIAYATRCAASLSTADCVHACLDAARAIDPATIFVPVDPRTLVAETIAMVRADAESLAVDPGRLALEIPQAAVGASSHALRGAAAAVREQGLRLAISGAGHGEASMRLIADLRPDFIRVAAEVVRGITASDAQRALAVALLSLGTHVSARLVADGIDSTDDRETLAGLGIQFGQGPLLGGFVAFDDAPERLAALRTDPRAAAAFTASASSPRSAPGKPIVAAAGSERLPHALSNAALALQAEHDPHSILSVIAEQLSLVVPVDDLSIYAADHATGHFVAVFATGPQAAEVLADDFPMTVGLNGWAFAQGTPQNVGNAGAHPASLTIPNTPFEHESLLLIPLVAGDHKLGMLNCRRMGINRFSDDDLEAASLFGHTAAAAWHNAQLYEELARRAMTDGLTGLFNSRWLREAGERELADARRRGVPLSVVLVDLDHFKAVNDTGGHASGDIVLQHVADVLRHTTRAGDAAVRLGGEEFVLILRDSDAAGAARVAADLRAAMTAVPIPAACSGIDRMTASLGIASFPEHGGSLADLVRAADVAMYVAKREGRDRVRIAPGAVPASDDGDAVA